MLSFLRSPRRALLCTAALLLGWVESAHALDLAYKWKVGEQHRFRYEEKTQLAMSGMMGSMMMPGGDGALRMTVRSAFGEKVLKVRPDGSADILLSIDLLTIEQSGGSAVNCLNLVPAASRKVRAIVDRKGHVRFERMITVYQHDGRYYVGGRIVAGPGGLSATASARGPQGEKVEVFGSVDPKTGRVEAGARVTKGQPAPQPPLITAEDPAIDVLPRRLFDLMVLPDGDLLPGTAVEVANPLGALRVIAEPMTGPVASVRVSTAAAATVVAPNQPAEQRGPAPSEGGLGMPGIPQGMGMPMGGGMPEPGTPPPAPEAGGVSTAMQMEADVKLRFDTALGRLIDVSGAVNTSTGMGNAAGMGGGMTIRSTLSLTRY